MLTKTEAIVLRSIKYGDARIITEMYTRVHGRLSFILPAPRSERSRIKKQYLQPLTLLSIECDVRVQQTLQKVRDAAILTPLPSLLADPKKISIGLFVAEFLYHALKGEQANVPLFDYLRNSIEWLDQAKGSYANYHLVLLMRMARFLGFAPNLEAPSPDKNGEQPWLFFDLRAASFCQQPPLHTDVIMPQEAAHIRKLMRMDYNTMHLFRLSRIERNQILQQLLLYYRIHLPAFPELQSVAVLSQLYAQAP